MKQSGKRAKTVNYVHSGEEEGQRDKRQQAAVALGKRAFDGESQITQQIGNENQKQRKNAHGQHEQAEKQRGWMRMVRPIQYPLPHFWRSWPRMVERAA